MPIVIRRSFRQPALNSEAQIYNSYPTYTIGPMHLDLPVLSLKRIAGRGTDCSSLQMNQRETINDGNQNSITHLDGPITFSNGPTVVNFFQTESGRFISPNNWVLTCAGNLTSGGGFTVTSPNGLAYEMKQFNRQLGSLSGQFSVSKITDPYGNWLNYEYETGTNVRYTILKSIEANDGRKVELSWIADSNGIYKTLKTLRSNGRKPHKVDYNYEPQSKVLTVTKSDVFEHRYTFNLGKLTKYELPTGGHVSYSYSSQLSDCRAFSTECRARYFPLIERAVSDGGTYTFEHRPRNSNEFMRIVRSPKTTVAYTFRKSTLPFRANRRDANVVPGPSDGKLLYEVNYGVPNMSWPPSVSPIVQKAYTYKKLKSVSTYYVSQDSDLIVPNTTKIYMNSDGGRFKSVFQTTYANHDEYGNSKTIFEYSADRSNGTLYRQINVNYKNQLSPHRFIGLVASRSIDNNQYESYEYNNKGSMISQTIDGINTRWTYHEGGNYAGELHTHSVGGRGTTRYTDYYRGIAKTIVDPMQRIKSVEVSSDGTIAAETQFGSSAQSFYKYDGARRLIQESSARNGSATTYYNWISPVQLVASKAQHTQELRYDAFGREIVRSDYSSSQNKRQTIRSDYDTAGMLVYQSYPTTMTPQNAISEALSKGKHYSYDGLGRLLSVKEDGHEYNPKTTYEYGYASSGNLTIKSRNLKGATTLTEYRTFARPGYINPIRVVDEHNVTAQTARDKLGRVVSVSREGVERRFNYGANGLLQSKYQPENGTTNYSYYDDGLLSRVSNNDQVISYNYHSDGQLWFEEFRVGSNWQQRQYAYDSAGRLNQLNTHEANGSYNSLSYEYDEENNLLKESLQIDGKNYGVEYSYDEHSSLSSIVYPNQRVYNLNPNAFGQPTRFLESGGKQIYSWITHNDNGATHDLVRDGFRIINTIGHGDKPRQNRIERYSENGSEMIAHKIYRYDNVGNITQILDTKFAGHTSYEYDNKSRLTRARGAGSNKWNFYYDNKDNLIEINQNGVSSILSYSATNRLNSVTKAGNTRQFKYDARGNTTEFSKFQGTSAVNGIAIDFNAANQVAKYKNVASYQYDGNGLRVKNTKSNSGSIYTFYGLGGQLMFRDDTGTGVTSEYFYVGGKLIARRDTDTSEHIVNNIPGLPVAELPSTGDVASQTPTFTWTAVQNATGYYLDVSQVPSDSTLIYQYYSSEDANCHAGQQTCSVIKADVPLTGHHSWKVRAVNSVGMSDWSQSINFSAQHGQVSSIPVAPLLDAPLGAISNAKPLFEWNPVENAVEYQLEVEQLRDNGNTVLLSMKYGAAEAGCIDLQNRCLIGASELTFSGQNRWRVRSVNTEDVGTWSGHMAFQVDDGGSTTGEIEVDGFTIRLPNDAWYQVQNSAGQPIGCDGVKSCTVDSAGVYIVINQKTGDRDSITVGEVITNTDEITVDGLTIHWTSSEWHQVQTEDGQNEICDGGASCTVPSAGIYIVINHKTGDRTPVITVDPNATTSGIKVNGLTISWPDNGWYQVQTADGLSNICNGGSSCTVNSPGDYLVINHNTNDRQTISVGG